MDLPYDLLVEKCEFVYNLTITIAQTKNIEVATRTQIHCKEWFLYRAGRVSALKTARDAYQAKMVRSHLNSMISDRGLVIHLDYPHLGASPDGFYTKCL